jgi:hypothetical protein
MLPPEMDVFSAALRRKRFRLRATGGIFMPYWCSLTEPSWKLSRLCKLSTVNSRRAAALHTLQSTGETTPTRDGARRQRPWPRSSSSRREGQEAATRSQNRVNFFCFCFLLVLGIWLCNYLCRMVPELSEFVV